MAFDLLIRGGTVLDGTGAPPFRADVAVSRDRIAAVENGDALADAEAAVTIDAAGRFVTPGFIDIHTHSDRSILINPRMESKIRQGVTTEIGGNCGSGVAPALGAALPTTRPQPGREYETITWPAMAEYFQSIEQARIAGNYATWVAHGTLRASTVGLAMRPPTTDELEAMKRLLRESLEAGGFGMSTGLIYVPSGYADVDELGELAKVVHEYGGLYASHIRNEGNKLLDAVGEAIEIGRRGDVPVQIAHHKASGKSNWGRVNDSLALMDKARSEGVDVACDQYPYVASSTGLSAVLPQWSLEGGREQMIARLRDSATRQKLREEMAIAQPDRTSLADDSGWDNILISRCRGNRTLEGKRLGQVARERGQDPFDCCFDLLVQEDGYVGCVFFSMCEEDVETVLRWPHTMIGSDASSVAPYGALGEGKPHPRSYGTFPRVLGRYVRERRVVPWEAAVYKMTGQPASRLGLPDRGVIRKGAFADLVVFQPDTVEDRATFQEPHQYAQGIEQVIVNGTPVVVDGEHTGALPGRVLRRA